MFWVVITFINLQIKVRKLKVDIDCIFGTEWYNTLKWYKYDVFLMEEFS